MPIRDDEHIPSLGELFEMGIAPPLPDPIGRADVDSLVKLMPAQTGFIMPPTRKPNPAAAAAQAQGGGSPLADLLTSAVKTLAAPAVHTGGDKALVEKIYSHAAEQRYPDYPPAKEPLFDTSGDVSGLTRQLVPQVSVADKLPPTPPTGAKSPKNDRMRPLVERNEEIAQRLADSLRGLPSMPFYATGPVLQGFSDIGGLSIPDARANLREWAGQGAATSPRTQTPPNLRNSSYLLHRRASGDPLTPERQAEEQASGMHGYTTTGNKKTGYVDKPNLNRPGFPMMEMHTSLADEFANSTVDPWKNPKPYTFRENWTGNMADVTADTHNIRAVLDAYDQLAPGTLPKEWFNSAEAYQRYRDAGGFPKEGMLPVGDIEDRGGSAVVPGTGKKAQTEYPLIQRPTARAAEILGIQPAEAQERLWFGQGHRTGLESPPMTIPDLFNAQIEQTARVTGLTPEAILRLWLQRRIPFAENESDLEMPGATAAA